MEDEPGKWDLLFEAIPPLAGLLGNIFGRDKPVTPKPLPPLFPEGQQALADWLFSWFFTKPGGGTDLYKLPTPISPRFEPDRPRSKRFRGCCWGRAARAPWTSWACRCSQA